MSAASGICVLCLSILASSTLGQPPNIVIILADDMGWNDVGFHGSDQIPTPNIDALAYNGIILNQHYTPALCTPSRAALLTGKYPIHTGMQHLVILESEPWGLGLNEKLLPEVLTEAGYVSHAVGKWHLGFYKTEYTPTKRGFQSHYGYWQGFHDYYNHSVKATYESYDGYDMRRNLDTDWSARGRYSTDLFTEESVRLIREHDTSQPMFLYLAHLAPHTGNMRDPFQAPDEVIAKFSHIADPERRVYAAMVSKLDESVGEVVSALKSKSMLENSVIIFMSDNGAPTHGIHSNRGSNYPLRGIKNSAWEGGVRTVAAVWSPLLKRQQRVSNQMMYMADWLPTLASAAGLDVKKIGKIDGVDMWTALSEGEESPRTEFVYNIDDKMNPYAAIRMGDWKYVIGSATGERNNEWYGETGRELEGVGYDTESVLLSKAGMAISGFLIKQQIQEKIQRSSAPNQVIELGKEVREWKLLNKAAMLDLRREAEVECISNNTELDVECDPLMEPCLFNLRHDPCELVNLASNNLHILALMEEKLNRYRQGVVRARNVPNDPSADPLFWNNTWSSWFDEIEKEEQFFTFSEYMRNVVYILFAIFVVIGILLVLVLTRHKEACSMPGTKKWSKKQRLSRTLSIFTIDSSSILKDKLNKVEDSVKDGSNTFKKISDK